VIERWGESLYRRFRLFLWGSAASFDVGLVQAYRWVLRMPPPERTGTLTLAEPAPTTASA